MSLLILLYAKSFFFVYSFDFFCFLESRDVTEDGDPKVNSKNTCGLMCP